MALGETIQACALKGDLASMVPYLSNFLYSHASSSKLRIDGAFELVSIIENLCQYENHIQQPLFQPIICGIAELLWKLETLGSQSASFAVEILDWILSSAEYAKLQWTGDSGRNLVYHSIYRFLESWNHPRALEFRIKMAYNWHEPWRLGGTLHHSPLQTEVLQTLDHSSDPNLWYYVATRHTTEDLSYNVHILEKAIKVNPDMAHDPRIFPLLQEILHSRHYIELPWIEALGIDLALGETSLEDLEKSNQHLLHAIPPPKFDLSTAAQVDSRYFHDLHMVKTPWETFEPNTSSFDPLQRVMAHYVLDSPKLGKVAWKSYKVTSLTQHVRRRTHPLDQWPSLERTNHLFSDGPPADPWSKDWARYLDRLSPTRVAFLILLKRGDKRIRQEALDMLHGLPVPFLREYAAMQLPQELAQMLTEEWAQKKNPSMLSSFVDLDCPEVDRVAVNLVEDLDPANNAARHVRRKLASRGFEIDVGPLTAAEESYSITAPLDQLIGEQWTKPLPILTDEALALLGKMSIEHKAYALARLFWIEGFDGRGERILHFLRTFPMEDAIATTDRWIQDLRFLLRRYLNLHNGKLGRDVPVLDFLKKLAEVMKPITDEAEVVSIVRKFRDMPEMKPPQKSLDDWSSSKDE